MDLQALRRWWPLAAVAVLLAGITLAAAHSTPQLDRLPAIERSTQSQRERERQAVDEEGLRAEEDRGASVDLPDWTAGVASVTCMVLSLAVIGMLAVAVVRGAGRRRAGLPGGEAVAGRPSDEEVIAALDAGLADLSDVDRDPRRAVIACWLRLEEAAAAAGMPRQVGDTPTDLVLRLLGGGGHAVSADVLAGFAELYRAARYSTHTVDEAMRRQAVTALHRLRAELTGSRQVHP